MKLKKFTLKKNFLPALDVVHQSYKLQTLLSLHDKVFGPGIPKFWHAGQYIMARHSLFCRVKAKFAWRGSLGQPKNGPSIPKWRRLKGRTPLCQEKTVVVVKSLSRPEQVVSIGQPSKNLVCGGNVGLNRSSLNVSVTISNQVASRDKRETELL